jgi:prepilin-type N-terminal cleavage/methylation domain-containing protein
MAEDRRLKTFCIYDSLCAPDEQGFTLLELLASLALIGIIVAVMAGSLRYSLEAVERGENKIRTIERMRNAVNIVDSQIQSHIPLEIEEEGEQRFYFQGRRDYMQFMTNYSIWGGKRGHVAVSYSVQDKADGGQSLTASEHMISTSVKKKITLFDHLNAIHFEYLSRDLTDGSTNWIEVWDDDFTLPEKVRLTVNNREKVLSVIIPIRSRGSLGRATGRPAGKTLWTNMKTVPQGR